MRMFTHKTWPYASTPLHSPFRQNVNDRQNGNWRRFIAIRSSCARRSHSFRHRNTFWWQRDRNAGIEWLLGPIYGRQSIYDQFEILQKRFSFCSAFRLWRPKPTDERMLGRRKMGKMNQHTTLYSKQIHSSATRHRNVLCNSNFHTLAHISHNSHANLINSHANGMFDRCIQCALRSLKYVFA